jgi:adenine-specific DNA-methyltransferase
MVTERMKRPRDSRQAHYTTSPDIVAYMVSRLRPTSDDLIWEPSAGRGDLVDGLLRLVHDAKIRASEIEPGAIAALRLAFPSAVNLEIRAEDVLDVGAELFDEHRARYTKVIANPPYGAWQAYDRRRDLKDRFPQLYVKETYSVFLYRAFHSLKSNGRLVFIIPDTFLWLHRHEFLRRHLFSNAHVEELALFPSRFFPGIHFGYSGLCIITLTKERPNAESAVRVFHSIKDSSVLMALANGVEKPGTLSEATYLQKKIVESDHCELHAFARARPTQTPHSLWPKLGDIAAVVTGFYSGNDRRWLRVSSDKVRGAKNYLQVDTSKIASPPVGTFLPLAGLGGEKCFIPIVRGGASHFVKPTTWYVNWSREAVAAYTRRGRNPARFQNAKFYFRQGLGVPMVASSTLTAALLNHRLFDQAIVGVFPHDERLLTYILAFLNTKLASELLREINPTANNSANYLKRLPIPLPNDQGVGEIDRLVQSITGEQQCEELTVEQARSRIEDIIRGIWNREDGAGASLWKASVEPHRLTSAATGA